MQKIIELLGLPTGATEEDALRVITKLKSSNAELEKAFADLEDAATPSAAMRNREKQIQDKMVAGLSREVAMEAIANQEAEDRRQATLAKKDKK